VVIQCAGGVMSLVPPAMQSQWPNSVRQRGIRERPPHRAIELAAREPPCRCSHGRAGHIREFVGDDRVTWRPLVIGLWCEGRVRAAALL
jgi:hypothetical protein